MHELYELKDKLCDELKDYSEKSISASNLEIIDKLTHSIKNLNKIIEEYGEGEYSGRYDRGRSYARGRTGTVRRDDMGRYSRRYPYSYDDGMVEQLRMMMNDAPNESVRNDINRLIEKIEKM